MTVADFHRRFLALTDELGVASNSTERRTKSRAVPFASGHDARAPTTPKRCSRFWRALVQVDRVLKKFRTGFLGKVSPVHLFWGSFDLAVTRFSGRAGAPASRRHPGLPDAVTREAYSHEVSSAGFWPGGGPVDYPAFYSYAYPAPEGFAAQRVAP